MVTSSCVSSPMQQGVALAGANTMPRSSTIGVGPMESQAEVTKVVVASSCVSSSMQHEVALAGIDTMPRSPIISGGVDGASEMVTPPRASRTLRSPLGEAGLTPSLERRAAVEEFGGIADPLAMGTHSSGRIRAQANADDTQMARAMALAQR
jgi:hypothetical protein